MEIGDEIQLCLAALWKHKETPHGRWPFGRWPPDGRNAGARLSPFPGVPADLVRTGYAISGVYDLAPLIGTSHNEALNSTLGNGAGGKPPFRPPPPKRRCFVAAVGSEESAEFLRQSREIAENWSRVGIDARYEVVADTNHLTIVEELITPGSSTLSQILALARWADAA